MSLKTGILDLIGDTPLVRLNSVTGGLESEIYAKLEFYNPSGSVKDRVARYIVEDAERRGTLTPGDTIVEATSGNMGVALALVAAVKGYKCVFTLPDSISTEKIRALKLYGAEVVLTPRGLPPSDERSCYKVAHKIARERGAFYVNQYFNKLNPEAHYKTTGPEIWRDTGGDVDAVLCGMGTGGTITGIGTYLKEMKRGVGIIGVEPVGSVFRRYNLEGVMGEASAFDIEGIGKNFIPSVVDFNCIDDVMQVREEDARSMVHELVRREGLLVGESSGAVVAAALAYAAGTKGRERIVAVLPDTGLKYLSRYTAAP